MGNERIVDLNAKTNKDRLDLPAGKKPRFEFQFSSEAFGRFAEKTAAFMGTAKFLFYMTIFIVVWISLNLIGIMGLRWDPYPFILLNLVFSTQASYAAPLILLAQNRQEARDRIGLEEDRRVAAQSRADMDFIAREIASVRLALGDLATRDFVRSELRDLLEELNEDKPTKNEQ